MAFRRVESGQVRGALGVTVSAPLAVLASCQKDS